MFEVIHVPAVLIQVHSSCNAGVLRDFKIKTTQLSHPLDRWKQMDGQTVFGRTCAPIFSTQFN